MNNYLQKNELKPVYAVFFILVIAFACLTYLHELTKLAVFMGFEDFGNYYFYSKAIWLHHDIYTMDEATLEKLRISFSMPAFSHPTGHSPAFFFLVKPITIFDFESACRIWLMLNNLLMFVSLFIILKLVCEKLTQPEKNFIEASSLFMILSFQPLIENMYCGQNNMPILFLFTMSLYFLREKRGILSGVMLALGIIVKPSFAIVLPLFLWKRCYRVFFSAAISLAASELLPILLYGKDVVVSYWTIGAKESFLNNINAVSMANLSLNAFVNRLGDLKAHPELAGVLLGVTAVASLALLLYAAHITRRRFKDFDIRFILEFSLMLLLLFIVCPVVHEHHYILLYLPIIAVWARLSRDTRPFRSFLFVISFLLIALKYSLIQFELFNRGFLSIFSGFKLYGVAILFFLTADIINEDSKRASCQKD